MPIRDYDPTQGCAFQGDLSIVPIPASIKISTVDEIKPVAGRLILQEGELSGHHHAIALLDRTASSCCAGGPTTDKRRSRAAEKLMADALAGRIAVPTARLYQDPAAVEALRRAGILTRTDLAIGCLIGEAGPMVISHEEHDGIRLAVGNYYIGRQVESAAYEERKVLD